MGALMADGKLVFFKPATGSGKLVFGDAPSVGGGALVSVKSLAGFVSATAELFNGTAWVATITTVTV